MGKLRDVGAVTGKLRGKSLDDKQSAKYCC